MQKKSRRGKIKEYGIGIVIAVVIALVGVIYTITIIRNSYSEDIVRKVDDLDIIWQDLKDGQTLIQSFKSIDNQINKCAFSIKRLKTRDDAMISMQLLDNDYKIIYVWEPFVNEFEDEEIPVVFFFSEDDKELIKKGETYYLKIETKNAENESLIAVPTVNRSPKNSSNKWVGNLWIEDNEISDEILPITLYTEGYKEDIFKIIRNSFIGISGSILIVIFCNYLIIKLKNNILLYLRESTCYIKRQLSKISIYVKRLCKTKEYSTSIAICLVVTIAGLIYMFATIRNSYSEDIVRKVDDSDIIWQEFGGGQTLIQSFKSIDNQINKCAFSIKRLKTKDDAIISMQLLDNNYESIHSWEPCINQFESDEISVVFFFSEEEKSLIKKGQCYYLKIEIKNTENDSLIEVPTVYRPSENSINKWIGNLWIEDIEIPNDIFPIALYAEGYEKDLFEIIRNSCITILGSIFIVILMNYLFWAKKKYILSFIEKLHIIYQIQLDKIIVCKRIICIMLVSILEWYQLDMSCNLGKMHIISVLCVILNICMLMIINLIIYISVNYLWSTLIISEVICTIIGLINYYVIQYHGMPLTITELKNFATALNVLGSYSLNIEIIPITILLIGLVVILCACLVRRKEHKRRRDTKSIMASCFAILLCGMYVLICCHGENPIKPQKTIGWTWKEAYGKYGYVACTVEDIYTKRNIINKPEEYNYDTVEIVYNKYSDRKIVGKDNGYPDIIFIVNETFYDLRHLVDFETDTDYLKNIRNMENLISGYAVSPSVGGGTNNSEYELLTSNSLYLMSSDITPFNVIDLKGATSIVSYLESLGYSTLGTHTESGSNYNRVTGYNELGFDIIKFEEEYENLEYYYDRCYKTDSSVYKNIEKWYEEMNDGPRFLYLLTMQNHGGWNSNRPEYDTVHITKGAFEIKDIYNEYLTSISLSDEAFWELTEYFKDVDRPVIICMVGDHCPTFASEIDGNNLSKDQRNLKLRETPFYIWSNYKLDINEIGSVSMPFVVPLLLKFADIPLSGYYEYLLDISENVPIITSYGKYFDSNYNCFSINEGQYSGLVNEYFQVEYSNINGEDLNNEFYK